MASAYAARDEAAIEAGTGTVLTSARPRISWSAVIAGVVLVMAIEILLGVLGAGIGLGMLRPGSAAAPDAGDFATGAGAWSLVSTVLALLIGSWAAARLAGVVSRGDGMLHGLVIWALALLVTVYLLSAAVGGALSMVGGLASAAGGGLRAVAPRMSGMTADAIGQQARGLLQPSASGDLSNMSAEDAQKEMARLLPDLAAGGERAAQARGRIIDIMSVQLRISHDEAAKRLDDARAKLTQGAQSAAGAGVDAASHAALIAFAGLLIGAVAAAVGGALARPRVLVVANRLR
jgi:hypothetical protein